MRKQNSKQNSSPNQTQDQTQNTVPEHSGQDRAQSGKQNCK